MLNINSNRLEQIAQEAFDKVSGDRRWERAIVKAKVEIEENPFIHWNGHALVILSPSNEIYEANGTCQCRAYLNHQPCWHRAAARLVKRYNEQVH